MLERMRSSISPAGPMKGRPESMSGGPGDSPTTATFARDAPSPKMKTRSLNCGSAFARRSSSSLTSSTVSRDSGGPDAVKRESCISSLKLVQVVAHLLHVVPDLAFLRGVAQKIRRVEGGHDLDAAVVLKLPAQARDALLRVEQVLHRRVAEHHDHVGARDVDFAQEEGLAGVRLFGGRLAVIGRAAAVDVADEHVVALEADGLDDLVEELAGAADEGSSARVLVRARSLADEHQTRGRLPLCVDDGLAPLMQRAADALADVGAYVLEGLAGSAEAQLVLRRDVAEERFARRGRVG